MKKLSILLFCLLAFQTGNSQDQINAIDKSALLKGVKGRKIDDFLILEKTIKLRPGNHKATFLVDDCFNIEEILHFYVEPNKNYSFKSFKSNYYDSISNSCVFDKDLTQVVEEVSGKIVGYVVSPIEFSLTDSLGANHYYNNNNKISKNDLFHLIINNNGNTIVINGKTKDNLEISFKIINKRGAKPNNIFLKPGIYRIEFISGDIKSDGTSITLTSYKNYLCFLAEPNYDGIVDVDVDKGFSFHPDIKSAIDVGLNNIFFLNNNLGWIVGNGGVLLRTTDGGKTWERRQFNPFENLNDTYFTDSIFGWIVGSGQLIMHTTDGGMNWVITGKSDKVRSDNYGKIHFFNKQEGFIIKTFGWTRPSVLYTNNSGNSWNEIDVGGTFFVFDKNIFKITLKETQLSTDLGKTWRPFIDKPVAFIYFTDSLNGWYLPGGEATYIVHTIDGGKTWVNQEMNIRPYGLFFVNENFGWALCLSSVKIMWGGGHVFCYRKIYYTIDGGKNWEMNIKPNGLEIPYPAKIYFLNKDKGFLIDRTYGMVYSTVDGGKNWSNFNVLELDIK